jgi:hypothetical protein
MMRTLELTSFFKRGMFKWTEGGCYQSQNTHEIAPMASWSESYQQRLVPEMKSSWLESVHTRRLEVVRAQNHNCNQHSILTPRT